MGDEMVLVCERITTPLMLPDNRLGKCRECGWKVQYRPHAPKVARICTVCALDRIDEVTEVLITQRTLDEVRDYLKKRRQ